MVQRKRRVTVCSDCEARRLACHPKATLEQVTCAFAKMLKAIAAARRRTGLQNSIGPPLIFLSVFLGFNTWLVGILHHDCRQLMWSWEEIMSLLSCTNLKVPYRAYLPHHSTTVLLTKVPHHGPTRVFSFLQREHGNRQSGPAPPTGSRLMRATSRKQPQQHSNSSRRREWPMRCGCFT